MNNMKGASGILVVFLLLILAAAGGWGYYAYRQKQAQSLPPVTSFEQIPLKEEVVVFVFQKVPRLYTRVMQLNTEILLINTELERIGALEVQYPNEKKFVQEERGNWTKLQKNLMDMSQTIRKNIESFYVAYSVNPEKGSALITGGLDDLLAQIDGLLKESKAETRRLKIVKALSPLDKIKNLFQ